MAAWSKLKRQMESFLAESLNGRVEYTSSSYRYTKDKPGQCYLKVDKKEVFQMTAGIEELVWYKTDQECKKGHTLNFLVSESEILALHEQKPMIPLDRLPLMIKEQKLNECAKSIMEAQNKLLKSDFFTKATEFLGTSIDSSMNSDDILLNVFALIDRRMGKSKLRKLQYSIQMKHSIVQYFYNLRCEVEGLK